MSTQVSPPRPVNEFTITEVTRYDGVAVVAVSGELDIATAPQLDDTLNRLAARERSIVVDLAEVSFLESTGLAVLLRASRKATSGGWSFALAPGLPEAVSHVLDMTNVTPHFTFDVAD